MRTKVNALPCSWAVTLREREELSALMPSTLDKAFKGEL